MLEIFTKLLNKSESADSLKIVENKINKKKYAVKAFLKATKLKSNATNNQPPKYN